MGSKTGRSAVALVGATVLTVALTACGGGGSGSSSGAGKTIDVLIAADTRYPPQQQAWQQSIADRYWGTSHEQLIADFYRTLRDPEPFRIGPREAARSLRLVHQLYRQNS